jgi:hypothetical protein
MTGGRLSSNRFSCFWASPRRRRDEAEHDTWFRRQVRTGLESADARNHSRRRRRSGIRRSQGSNASQVEQGRLREAGMRRPHRRTGRAARPRRPTPCRLRAGRGRRPHYRARHALRRAGQFRRRAGLRLSRGAMLAARRGGVGARRSPPTRRVSDWTSMMATGRNARSPPSSTGSATRTSGPKPPITRAWKSVRRSPTATSRPSRAVRPGSRSISASRAGISAARSIYWIRVPGPPLIPEAKRTPIGKNPSPSCGDMAL